VLHDVHPTPLCIVTLIIIFDEYCQFEIFQLFSPFNSELFPYVTGPSEKVVINIRYVSPNQNLCEGESKPETGRQCREREREQNKK
jgi:hypothetical protein